MSELQDLLVALDGVTKEAEQHAAQLAQHARQLGQAASSAASATQGSGRADSKQTAAALQSAQRSISQAAQHLHQAALAGKGFVARYAGGGRAGGPESLGCSPEFAPGANPETRPPWATPRYIAATAAQQSTFAQAVSYFGAHGIGGWISSTNPNYLTGDAVWTNNCGPCSRAVADAYQGVGTAAAFGDSEQPPGEYGEMWAAVGVQPSTGISNPGRLTDPATFSANAYASLEAQLLQEGPGAVAIVGVDWDDPRVPQGQAGGHWFNAYVDDQGTVRWADGQSGQEGGWPPGYSVPIWYVEAVVRPSGGQPWKEVLL